MAGAFGKTPDCLRNRATPDNANLFRVCGVCRPNLEFDMTPERFHQRVYRKKKDLPPPGNSEFYELLFPKKNAVAIH